MEASACQRGRLRVNAVDNYLILMTCMQTIGGGGGGQRLYGKNGQYFTLRQDRQLELTNTSTVSILQALIAF